MQWAEYILSEHQWNSKKDVVHLKELSQELRIGKLCTRIVSEETITLIWNLQQ